MQWSKEQGTVKWFNASRALDSSSAKGRGRFRHFSAIVADGYKSLE